MKLFKLSMAAVLVKSVLKAGGVSCQTAKTVKPVDLYKAIEDGKVKVKNTDNE